MTHPENHPLDGDWLDDLMTVGTHPFPPSDSFVEADCSSAPLTDTCAFYAEEMLREYAKKP